MISEKINILYVSNLCSERLIGEMLLAETGMPNLAAQKYHRLLAQGIAMNKDLFNINVISVPEYSHSPTGKKWIRLKSEFEKDVKYDYSPILFFPVIKRLIIVLFLLIKIIKYRLVSDSRKNYIVFDILNFSTSFISIISSKIFRFKSIAIVTDLPEMMYVLQPKIHFLNKVTYSIKNNLLKISDGYVFLTKEMNFKINERKKPFCIIEGLADLQTLSNISIPNYASNKIIHYSGGLFEKFGVKALIEAFMLISRDDIRLQLFGNGDLTEFIAECQKKDSRIEFFGYKNNPFVLDHQQNSFVLVNPRFSKGEYNLYSFPSKTIEYMSSGIPLLSTKLPGIPQEYFEHIFFFKDETVNGYKTSLTELLNKPKEEMKIFGENARKFLLAQKNNSLQAKKLHHFIINNL